MLRLLERFSCASLIAEDPATLKAVELSRKVAPTASNRGNRTRAAAQLGISLRTLQYRLKEYGLEGL